MPNGTYYVLMSTNLALPRANWTVVGTNVLTEAAAVRLRTGLVSILPRQFFLLRSP